MRKALVANVLTVAFAVVVAFAVALAVSVAVAEAVAVGSAIERQRRAPTLGERERDEDEAE